MLFIFCRSPYSVYELIECLLGLPIDITRAQYLEGGPEASLYVSAGGRALEFVGSFETGFNPSDDNDSFWPLPNVIGVGGDWRPTKDRIGQWQIPYGVLVPKEIDNLLASGRCVSGDPRLADYLRIIPTCFVTGHAAGCAAALAIQDNCRPRDVNVPKLQKVLREQDAYLG